MKDHKRPKSFDDLIYPVTLRQHIKAFFRRLRRSLTKS